MKIERLQTHRLMLPLEKPIATAIHQIDSIGCIALQLQSDGGLVGEGLVFTINGLRIDALEAMIKGYQHHVLEKDPHYVAAINESIWQEINPTGHKGLTIAALSAIDAACWDLVGKRAGLPLSKVFGRVRDSIKTYASGGMWLGDDIVSLQDQATEFVSQGFKSIKVRVGSESQDIDIVRLKAVRHTVGDDVELLCDANQSFNVKQAIRFADALKELDVNWFEEPVFAGDLNGHRRVRDAVPIDVASGETEYTQLGMKSMLDAGACDVLMPDFQRLGGYSQMRTAASLAMAYHIPISTHIFTEYSLNIAGSSSNCISVEHMPWFEPLFEESMQIVDGEIKIPDLPGNGFSFCPESLARYSQ